MPSDFFLYPNSAISSHGYTLGLVFTRNCHICSHSPDTALSHHNLLFFWLTRENTPYGNSSLSSVKWSVHWTTCPIHQPPLVFSFHLNQLGLWFSIIITPLKIASTPTLLCLLCTCPPKPQHCITPNLHQTVGSPIGRDLQLFSRKAADLDFHMKSPCFEIKIVGKTLW